MRRRYPSGWRRKYRARPYTMKQKSALKLAKSNRRKINSSHEVKWKYLPRAVITTATNGVVIPISLLAVGNTPITRIGDKIHAESIEIRCEDDSTDGVTVRVMLVKDNQQHGTLPVITDILAEQTIIAPRNAAKLDRYKVIWDSVKGLSSDINGQNWIMKRKLNHNIAYIGDAADQASQGKGNLYLVVISHNAGGADSFGYSTMLGFSD